MEDKNDDFTPICEECTEEVDEEMFLIKITNSPRMGECGYEGDNNVYEIE